VRAIRTLDHVLYLEGTLNSGTVFILVGGYFSRRTEFFAGPNRLPTYIRAKEYKYSSNYLLNIFMKIRRQFQKDVFTGRNSYPICK
jgi:hypothetical protein